MSRSPRYRFYEIIPGVNIWLIFFIIIFFSIVRPIWAIYFIIVFDLYWTLKIIYLLIFLLISWGRYRKTLKIQWLDKLKNDLPEWQKIYHLIILPTYKENITVVGPTFEGLLKTNYPKDKFIVVMTGEERDKERFLQVAEEIKNKYEGKFLQLLITMHPRSLPDEMPGKGSNTNWAGWQVKKIIDEMQIPYENIIVSCFDMDTIVHPEYFSYLTYRYLTVPDPVHTSFQPFALFNNNIWDSPAFTQSWPGVQLFGY